MPRPSKPAGPADCPLPGDPDARNSCPDFSLPATGGTTFTLAAARRPLVLYFYPKDNTPGCSNEAQAFAALHADFEAAGCEVAGISRDSLKSHENFRAKFDLPFPCCPTRMKPSATCSV